MGQQRLPLQTPRRLQWPHGLSLLLPCALAQPPPVGAAPSSAGPSVTKDVVGQDQAATALSRPEAEVRGEQGKLQARVFCVCVGSCQACSPVPALDSLACHSGGWDAVLGTRGGLLSSWLLSRAGGGARWGLLGGGRPRQPPLPGPSHWPLCWAGCGLRAAVFVRPEPREDREGAGAPAVCRVGDDPWGAWTGRRQEPRLCDPWGLAHGRGGKTLLRPRVGVATCQLHWMLDCAWFAASCLG